MNRSIVSFVVATIVAACGGATTSTATAPSADGGSLADSESADAPTDALVDVADAAAPDASPPTLDPSPCLSGGSVWHLDRDFGDDGTMGPVTYTTSEQFSFNAARSPVSLPAAIYIGIQGPTIQSPSYDLQIGGAADSHGEPAGVLEVGTYTMASSFPPAGDPTLNLTGNGSACSGTQGSFEITELSISDAGQMSLTVAFIFNCTGATPTVGCVHVENAPQGG
jgi:hypothetical protein